ncbi:MAG TPA: beta-glucosidase [Gammaproteobacteria bacterium]|nr:beta-glucosidase [Gammaproteobacteria bacterium]
MKTFVATVVVAWMLAAVGSAQAQTKPPADRPWLNPKLSPDERAALLERAMTLPEKIGLLHGKVGSAFRNDPAPAGALGSAGFIPGIPRLGVPALQESDAGLGVTNPQGVRPGDAATALPATLALAATFNPELAFRSGVVIGSEARSKGFNVMLAGGVNLARDPRNGRNFEYFGEDPLLAGTLAGEAVRGIQSRNVISTVKHFALNDQETGRLVLDTRIAEDAFRESDLLAFEIAIERGKPGAVMCAYNGVNGDYACGNDWLLNRVLKGDWRYPGWVMSDWGAAHALDYALKGLDQQSGEQIDTAVFFDEPLAAAVAAGQIPESRISDMVRRILRSMFAVGLFNPAAASADVDYDAHAADARAVAEQSIVVLRNERNLLPLSKDVRRIAVIGGYADLGVMSGGGSSQVTAVGMPARIVPMGGEGLIPAWRNIVLHPSPPVAAIRALAPGAEVRFVDSRYSSAAAAAAANADVAIVFATQWMLEHYDAPDLSLPSGQDDVIRAVAAANRNTVVVLQTGGPVLMPWLAATPAVVAAWFPGQEGGAAIGNVLFGVAEPAGRLPLTFPAREADLPRPAIPGIELQDGRPFVVDYPEGSDVGYRWFARRGSAPAFPFGYGLSYTTFRYGGLAVSGARDVRAEFDVTNTGARAGWAVPQVYLTAARGVPERRLLGWGKALLAPGETKHFAVAVDARLLAEFDAAGQRWSIAAGDYEIALGDSAETFAARRTQRLSARTLPP